MVRKHQFTKYCKDHATSRIYFNFVLHPLVAYFLMTELHEANTCTTQRKQSVLLFMLSQERSNSHDESILVVVAKIHHRAMNKFNHK